MSKHTEIDIAGAARQRITGRTGNVSDATVAVARHQESYNRGAIDWNRIDVSGGIEILENSIIWALAGAPTADPDL